MWSRRAFLEKSGAAAMGVMLPGAIVRADSGVSKEAEAIYRRSIVIDTLTIDGPRFDVGRAIEAGLTACVVDLPIYPRNHANATKALAEWNEAMARPDSRFLKVLRGDDIEAARAQKKFGVILACQDAAILDASTGSVNDYNIQNLRKFYEQGLRILQLTHNDRNGVADAFREKNDGGLSRLGERVVATMNELRMLIDLSHCSDRTTMETIRLSKRPCAITHTGCRALYPTRRNKTDAQIRACARKGGVIGIFNMSNWLTMRRTNSIYDVVDHIDHVVRIAGIDHVSFGSDHPVLGNTTPHEQQVAGMRGYVKRNYGLPGAERYPHHVTIQALNGPDRLLRLAYALGRRGYKAAAIEKIIGGNFARLFKEVCG